MCACASVCGIFIYMYVCICLGVQLGIKSRNKQADKVMSKIQNYKKTDGAHQRMAKTHFANTIKVPTAIIKEPGAENLVKLITAGKKKSQCGRWSFGKP